MKSKLSQVFFLTVQVQSFLKFSENSVEITRKEFFAAAKKQHALIDL